MRKKGYLIVMACLLISGCQSNKEVTIYYQEQVEILEEKIQSYENELNENGELIRNLEQEILNCNDKENEVSNATDVENRIMENETLVEFTVENVVSYIDGTIYFAESSDNIVANYTLNLIGYDSELHDDELKVFNYSEGDSIVKLKIHGNLYNMKVARVEWNDKMTEYSIIETICEHKKIDNSIVLFDSLLSEGYPFEVLIWEDKEGNQKFLPIQVDGYGFSNIVIICDEYSN